MKIIIYALITLVSMNLHAQVKKESLHEKWISCFRPVVAREDESQNKGQIEIEFRPDGTFTYNARHTNDWYSYAQGTYHYRKDTDEIFVHVTSGGFDWLYKPATETNPELYWAESHSDYQLYFKITARNDSEATVSEYINSYCEDIPESTRFYEKNSVWKVENGKYTLIGKDKKRMKETTYCMAVAEE